MSRHPTAIVDPQAKVGSDVEIGPYCIIGPNVEIGAGCRLISHVVVAGHTSIGAGCRVFPFASLGQAPQDLKYKGEDSRLIIGDHNTIREYVTMHVGTKGGGMVTRIGSNCLFMASSHVGHDCQVGDHVILANCVGLAGHVVLGDHVIIGGLAGVHQFVRIGEHAFIGGLTPVTADVMPYAVMARGAVALSGLNIVGLKRRGFSREQLQNLRSAYEMLAAEDGTFKDRVEHVAERFKDDSGVKRMVDFIRSDTSRAMTLPERRGAASS